MARTDIEVAKKRVAKATERIAHWERNRRQAQEWLDLLLERGEQPKCTATSHYRDGCPNRASWRVDVGGPERVVCTSHLPKTLGEMGTTATVVAWPW